VGRAINSDVQEAMASSSQISPATPAETCDAEPPRLRALELAYCTFLVIAVGRLGELLPAIAALPLAKVSMGIAIALLAIKWKALWRLPPVVVPFKRTSLALAAVAVVTAPFSVWRGATFGFLYQELPVLAAAVVVACKISSNWFVLRRIITALIVGSLALALSALKAFHGGRASIGATYDANDLAYLLVSIMPLALGFALTTKTRLRRLVGIVVFGIVILTLLLTGSRGGFLGLLAVLIMLVLVPIRRPQVNAGKARRRILPAILGIALLTAVIWPYLPAETRSRLATVVALGTDYNSDTSDIGSRSNIWERNLTAALRRPVGYGVGTFPMVDLQTGGRFRAPHNSYLETLVELGFIGMFLFLRMYVLSWRALQKARASLLASAATDERDAMLVFARMLQMTLVGNAVAGFFLSMAYATTLWVLFAVVISLVSLVASNARNPSHCERTALEAEAS
jgi:O-antigen ligase